MRRLMMFLLAGIAVTALTAWADDERGRESRGDRLGRYLEAENNDLRRENAQLSRESAQFQQMMGQAADLIEMLEKRNPCP